MLLLCKKQRQVLYNAPKIEFVVNRLKVERKAASRYLRELEKIGVLESQKVGRESLYINKELIFVYQQRINYNIEKIKQDTTIE